jgi:Tfp pilus assembly protein PilE
MKKGRIGGRKVFIIIIAGITAGILATIAVPLYKGYVERNRITKATSIMGTIITSQKVEKSRTGKYYSASTVAEFKSRGIPITNTKFFTYETGPTPNGGFTVTATPTDAFGSTGEWLEYIKEPDKLGRIGWTGPPPIKEPHPMLHIEIYKEPLK